MLHSSPSNTTKLKVLLLGSNPSIKSSSDVAFYIGTKSFKIVEQWIKGIDAEFHAMNVASFKTENNRPLKSSEINKCLPALMQDILKLGPDRIVALGKTAHQALTLLHLKHLEMPHPSGLNRKLNDKNYTEQKIKELAAFCTASSVVESVVV